MKEYPTKFSTRRDFIKNMAFGGSALFLFSNIGILQLSSNAQDQVEDSAEYSMILVDFNKCTGCRTCETVCSAYNQKVKIGDEYYSGLGNPHYSNIRVHNYNPDLDIPIVCAMCPDNPCIESCPVSPHPTTGRRALYREKTTNTVRNDKKRCIGCGNCAKACKENSAGVIIPNPDTNKPERICTLCDGDPQCVKYCPYEALTYTKVSLNREFYRLPANEIAQELTKRLYNF